MRQGADECFAAHVSAADRFTHCRSPHSPELYLYTPDYPAVADFAITQVIRASSAGHLALGVRNLGRHGRLKEIACSVGDFHVGMMLDEPIEPGDSRVFTVRIHAASGDTAVCYVAGESEDGTSECPSHECANNRFETRVRLANSGGEPSGKIFWEDPELRDMDSSEDEHEPHHRSLQSRALDRSIRLLELDHSRRQ